MQSFEIHTQTLIKRKIIYRLYIWRIKKLREVLEDQKSIQLKKEEGGCKTTKIEVHAK